MSPKLFRTISDACGLDDRERMDAYNRFAELYEKSHNAGTKNIYTTISMMIDELKSHDLPPKTMANLNRAGFAPIAFYFTLKSVSKYNTEILDEIADIMSNCCDDGKFSPKTYLDFMRAVKILRAYHEKGALVRGDTKIRQERLLSEDFEVLLSTYSERICDYYTLSRNTVYRRSSAIRMFLYNLEENHDIHSADGFTHRAINEGVTTLSTNYDYGGLRSIIPVVRQFLHFLFEAGITTVDYCVAVPKNAPKHRKIHQGFTESETAKILGSVDRNTVKGKRNYAIMLIASRTGLRAVDIANLKFDNIDWRTNEIRIVQRKTGNPLSLPLTAEIGNALAEYILQVRFKKDSPLIFGHIYSGKALQPQSICAIVKKYAKFSGITTPDNRYGVHCFRRGFGKSLLESSVPIDMINELLGHTEMNSSRPYLAIDEMGLKKCAISLALNAEVVAS